MFRLLPTESKAIIIINIIKILKAMPKAEHLLVNDIDSVTLYIKELARLRRTRSYCNSLVALSDPLQVPQYRLL